MESSTETGSCWRAAFERGQSLESLSSDASFSSLSEPNGIKFIGFIEPNNPPREPPDQTQAGRWANADKASEKNILAAPEQPAPIPPGHLDLRKAPTEWSTWILDILILMQVLYYNLVYTDF